MILTILTIRTLTTAFLLATATLAFADADFERTLSVSAPADLYISTGSGTIRISPGSDNQVHIKGHVHAGLNVGSRDIEDRVRQIAANPPIEQSGNTIRAGQSNDQHLFDNISISYEVSAPASVALNLRSGSGDVEVNHVGRFLTASSGSGSVRAHGIHGPADLHSGSGDIELQQEAPGEITTETGSGSIRINGLNGGLTARTSSGDIEANGQLTGPAHLSTGSGSVRLNLTPDAHFQLEASTGSGGIRVHFPNVSAQNDQSRHRLNEAVNGGGPLLEAHTGSGDIEINGGQKN